MREKRYKRSEPQPSEAQHLSLFFFFPLPQKDLAPASYYLRWVNLWNNSGEEGYFLPQGENGYVWHLMNLAWASPPIYQHVIKTF